MFIQTLFLGIVLFVVVLVLVMVFLPSYKDKPKILLLKKADLVVQYILIGINLLCLISVIFWVMFIVLLPLLGLVQLLSVAYHAYFKALTAYHRTYLKVLAVSLVVVLLLILLLADSSYILVMMLFGFSMGIYYWIISIKTINSALVLEDTSSEVQ